MSSAICFNLDQSKILLSVNGLTHIILSTFVLADAVGHKTVKIQYDYNSLQDVYVSMRVVPKVLTLHSQLSLTCLIGSLAYQQIDEKIDVTRKSSGISGVWRTSPVCNR